MSNPVLDAAQKARDKAQATLDKLMKTPTDEGRALNDDEAEKFEKLAGDIKKYDRQIEGLEKQEARVAKAAAAAAAKPTVSAGDMVVRSEPGIYRRDASPQHGEPSFLRDLAMVMIPQTRGSGLEGQTGGAAAAWERMQQNWKEIQRDADQGTSKPFAARIVDEVRRWAAAPDMEARVNPNTTAGTGGEFVPPLWLVGQYVPFMQPDRVCANRVNSMPLPPGIDVINIPKITTGTKDDIQTANAQPVTSRDIVTSTVSANVNTIAGQEDISLQLLEQSPIAMDGVVFGDLSASYSVRLDTQLLVGTGSNGQHQGVLTQTNGTSNTSITQASAVTCSSTVFADASTTGTQLRSIANGINQVETLRLAPATAIWVHPRKHNHWQVTAFDTQGRPVYVVYPQFNAFGVDVPNNVAGISSLGSTGSGVAGSLLGLPVVKDANIPTTCATSAVTGGTGDVIAVVKEDDLYLWEGTMRMRALPEILSGTLQIRYQLYCYSAFTPLRFPPSTSIITGTTGLAAPTF